MNPDFRTLNDATTFNDFELQALAAGMTLCGKYRLELEAGKGGMGVVWKAWDSIGGRWVALKFVPPEIRHQESAMAQIRNVFQTIQALNHPNICPIYGLEFDAAYGFFVVKKWLEGQSLSETRLARDQVVPVLEKVADALDYAHSEGVLHRDVKPSNIFLGTDGKVTLIDFGIAVNLHSATQATRGQFSTSGTDKYMAPEQRTGQLQTAQTDEYSLALVALELLAGTLSPLAYRRISPETQSVLDVALSDSPSERYATCRAFTNALSSIRKDDVPVVPRTSSSAKSAMEQVLEAERELEEAQRRAEEARRRAEAEAKQKRIQDLDEIIAEEYRSGRYAEALGHIEDLQKLAPDHQDARELKKRCEEKLVAIRRPIVSPPTEKPKKSVWRWITFLLVLFFALTYYMWPAEMPRDSFEWDGTKITKFIGKETEVVIPKGVTEIGNSTFYGCSSLTSVVIPKGVTGIGGYAFWGCSSLTSVVIPKGVTGVGGYAFWGCSSLTSVVIPEGVTGIGIGTFSGCSSLTSVVIPEGVTVIGRYAFWGCSSLTSVVIPEGVTEIGFSVFSGCSSLTSVVIPEGVTMIGDFAFADCPNLTIHGKKWSMAEKYAKERGIPFEAL